MHALKTLTCMHSHAYQLTRTLTHVPLGMTQTGPFLAPTSNSNRLPVGCSGPTPGTVGEVCQSPDKEQGTAGPAQPSPLRPAAVPPSTGQATWDGPVTDALPGNTQMQGRMGVLGLGPEKRVRGGGLDLRRSETKGHRQRWGQEQGLGERVFGECPEGLTPHGHPGTRVLTHADADSHELTQADTDLGWEP